jgi:hypothetical protein
MTLSQLAVRMVECIQEQQTQHLHLIQRYDHELELLKEQNDCLHSRNAHIEVKYSQRRPMSSTSANTCKPQNINLKISLPGRRMSMGMEARRKSWRKIGKSMICKEKWSGFGRNCSFTSLAVPAESHYGTCTTPTPYCPSGAKIFSHLSRSCIMKMRWKACSRQ